MQLKATAIDRLVVDLDDPAADAAVLAWATREAALRQCTLQVLANRSNSVPEFLGEAVDARLLIVGSPLRRGDGRRSSCPIVIVRGTRRPRLRRIVVGVDGSNASANALRWAVAEATRYAATVTVVHAWQQPAQDDRSLRGGDLRRADAVCIADLAADLCELHSQPLIQRRAVNGPAADVLIAESADADLLVVGSRSSGYRTLQFGSVALETTERADCPVVVVQPRLLRSGTGDPSDATRTRRS